ncbi:MAG: cell division protein SepF [Clostridia bacterium]|nr:cell division protein SepF [Clostridia bacterium]
MFESLAEKLKRMKSEEAGEPQFKDYDEVVETPAPREEKVVVEEQPTIVKKPAAAPAMVTNTNDSDSNIELKVVRPADFEEVSDIADYLLSGCTVVLNLELLDQGSTLRMLDFLNGVTYSTDGEIKNVSKSTYIITPNNVDVSDH